MVLDCQNVCKSYGTNVILNNISFHLEEKEKMAVVGVNGAGKTTLLRIITGIEAADSGNVIISKDKTIGYLSQHQDYNFTDTIYGEMLSVMQPVIELQDKIRQLENDMKHLDGRELDNALSAYNRYTHEFEYKNGYTYENEIKRVLKGLGFAEEDYGRHASTLSGGQKTRLSLGKLLLLKPDIIILDEPTNHLDMPSVNWLENFLYSYKGSMIIVSHDRYFLDKIVTKTVEIDNASGTVYNGNYTYFSQKRIEIHENMMKAYLNQQREIKHQEEVITKLKQFNREKSIKRAESREKMLDKMDRLERPVEACDRMRISLEPDVISGEDVLNVTGLSKAFGSNVLFENIDMYIKRGEHTALIGGNGTGKTTLLKIINRMVSKDAGTVSIGSRVHIGYYDQEHQILGMENTIFEEISNAYPDLNNTRIRNVLAAFLFTGEDVFKKIGDLSGGERGRVSLAKLMLSSANFLILDEPTNHLDIISKEILENAINNYTGTILYVSHDRYFINRTATKIIELKDKKLTNYIGNYDYYETHRITDLNDNGKMAANPISGKKAGDSQTHESSAKLAWMENKANQSRQRKKANDIKRLEEKISFLEDKLASIDDQFALPENVTNPEKLIELTEEREKTSSELELLYDEWEKLSE